MEPVEGFPVRNAQWSAGMAVTVICPNLRCRSALQVPDVMRGKVVRCGRCGKNFLVPMPVSERPPRVPAEAESEAAAQGGAGKQ